MFSCITMHVAFLFFRAILNVKLRLLSSDEIRFFVRLQKTPIRIVAPSLLMDPALRHSREVAPAKKDLVSV